MRIIGFLAAFYVLLVGAVYLFQRNLIYFPDRSRVTPAGFGVGEMAPVTLSTADGFDLVAWWRAPEAAGAPVVVFYHGNAGHIGNRGFKIRSFLDQGWGVLLTTWRGYSGNPGRPTEQGLYADGRAALAFLQKEGIARDRIVLYGESLGSGVAVQMASEAGTESGPGGTAFGALVLEAPFTSAVDVGARAYPIFPVRYLMHDRFDSAAKIGRVRVPLLIVHGERDRVVATAFGRRLLDAAHEPKEGRFIPGAGHNNLYDFGAAQVVVDFIRRRLVAKIGP
jgi:fermentation-respiration switch protein FrsA (DUF1100 family)